MSSYPLCWSSSAHFDLGYFRPRLKRGSDVKRAYTITHLCQTTQVTLYRVVGGEEIYKILIDLEGKSFFCTCPDGAHATVFEGKAASLCKHVIGCLLFDGNEGLLAPYMIEMMKRMGIDPDEII